MRIKVNLPESSQGSNFMVNDHFSHRYERLALAGRSTRRIKVNLPESSQGTNLR
jgi:hypothetical protein